MIVKEAYAEYLRPGLARDYFYSLYGPRRKGQSRRSYRNLRRRAFEVWIATFVMTEEDED